MNIYRNYTGGEYKKKLRRIRIQRCSVGHNDDRSSVNEPYKQAVLDLLYLAGVTMLGLTYLTKCNDLTAFSDAIFADFKNLLTACGFFIKLIRHTVAWRTHKQTYVALSTC